MKLTLACSTKQKVTKSPLMKARNHSSTHSSQTFLSLSIRKAIAFNFMGYVCIASTIIGLSASFILFLPNLKRWQKQQIATKKLKIINEALAHAEERAMRYQQRHDHILTQICSHYLSHQDLEEALAAARAAMNEALRFVVRLREMQIKILINFPDEANISVLDISWLLGEVS